MRTIFTATAMSLCVVSLATVVSADTLVMRDGTRAEGTVLAIAGRTITFQHADGVSRRYPTSRVQSLEFFSADHDNPRAASARTPEASARGRANRASAASATETVRSAVTSRR